jgi:cell division protein FtsB
MIYQTICHPHPTLRSAETIHLLTVTVRRLQKEVKALEAERSRLETTVYTLSQQARRLRPSPSPEPQP